MTNRAETDAASVKEAEKEEEEEEDEEVQSRRN